MAPWDFEYLEGKNGKNGKKGWQKAELRATKKALKKKAERRVRSLFCAQTPADGVEAEPVAKPRVVVPKRDKEDKKRKQHMANSDEFRGAYGDDQGFDETGERVQADYVEADYVEADYVEADHEDADYEEAERVQAEREEAEREEAERWEAELKRCVEEELALQLELRQVLADDDANAPDPSYGEEYERYLEMLFGLRFPKEQEADYDEADDGDVPDPSYGEEYEKYLENLFGLRFLKEQETYKEEADYEATDDEEAVDDATAHAYAVADCFDKRHNKGPRSKDKKERRDVARKAQEAREALSHPIPLSQVDDGESEPADDTKPMTKPRVVIPKREKEAKYYRQDENYHRISAELQEELDIEATKMELYEEAMMYEEMYYERLYWEAVRKIDAQLADQRTYGPFDEFEQDEFETDDEFAVLPEWDACDCGYVGRLQKARDGTWLCSRCRWGSDDWVDEDERAHNWGFNHTHGSKGKDIRYTRFDDTNQRIITQACESGKDTVRIEHESRSRPGHIITFDVCFSEETVTNVESGHVHKLKDN